MSGPFKIPIFDYQSCAGVRRVYRDTFNRDWPHDDKYLRELAREVRQEFVRPGSMCQSLLFIMREQDTAP